MNERELNLGIESVVSSWHGDYKDSNFVFVGGLSFRLNEGDVKVVFSQWGTVVHVNLIREKKTGKSKGYAFIGYEEQKSTILAVDNMNGTTIDGRQITVDHKKDYKIKEKEEDKEEGDKDKKREREEEVILDERALKRKKKMEKKEKKREMRREEKKKELMRMAFSQSTTITLEDLDVLEKVQSKFKNVSKEDEKLREMEKQRNLDMYKDLMAASEPEKKPNPKDDKKKAFTLPPEDPDKDNWKKKEIIPAWKYTYENGGWKRSDIHSYRYSWDNLNNMEDAKLKIPGPKEDKDEKEKEKEKK
uniref:RRM domain-containing protein n=1 Tax=Arcella intermedia TaxID=1963864 RepID=A0A6B2LBB0_9EUKA